MAYHRPVAEAQSVPGRKLAVTLLAPLAVAVIGRWPLPVLHLDALERTGVHLDPTQFGLFSLGLNPVLSAFLLVEIAALIVPRWRPLRHGSPGGRARLGRWVRALALVLASMQSFFIFRWMQGMERAYAGMGITPDSTAGWLVVIVAPIAGSFLLLWITDLISEQGLANGFSVLLAGSAIAEIAGQVIPSVRARLQNGDNVLGPLALTAMVVVALAASTARRPTRGWRQRPLRPELLVPISALLPVTMCLSLLALPGQLAKFTSSARIEAVARSLAPGSTTATVVRFALVALLGAAFAWLLARPALVAPVWRTGLRALAGPTEGNGDDENASADALARAAYRRALWQTLAFLGALTFLGWLADGAYLVIDAGSLFVVACVALDVAGELRFRRAHAEVAGVTAEHRLYAVGPALAVLAAAGIANFPRALRHRTLLAFWAPYLPIEILVPLDRADEARALLTPWSSPVVASPDAGA